MHCVAGWYDDAQRMQNAYLIEWTTRARKSEGLEKKQKRNRRTDKESEWRAVGQRRSFSGERVREEATSLRLSAAHPLRNSMNEYFDARALVAHRHVVCCEAARCAAGTVRDVVHRIERAREEEALALLRLLRREKCAQQRRRERSVALEACDALHRAVRNVHARSLGEALGAEVVTAAQARALVAALLVHAYSALVLGATPCDSRLVCIVRKQRPEPRLAVAIALRRPQRRSAHVAIVAAAVVLPPRVKRTDDGAVVRAGSSSRAQRCVSQELDPSKHDRLAAVI